jgi:hypothetical protein
MPPAGRATQDAGRPWADEGALEGRVTGAPRRRPRFSHLLLAVAEPEIPGALTDTVPGRYQHKIRGCLRNGRNGFNRHSANRDSGQLRQWKVLSSAGDPRRATTRCGHRRARRVAARDPACADHPGALSVGYIDLSARFALDHGLHVVIEGILHSETYGEMLTQPVPGPSRRDSLLPLRPRMGRNPAQASHQAKCNRRNRGRRQGLGTAPATLCPTSLRPASTPRSRSELR